MRGCGDEGSGGRDQRGAGTLLTVGVMAVAVLIAAGLVIAAVYLGAAHRARGAADLAALSAASRVPGGGDVCGAAERIAARNGAEVETCTTSGDQVEWVVHVRVRKPVAVMLPGLPDAVAAQAWAGSASLADPAGS